MNKGLISTGAESPMVDVRESMTDKLRSKKARLESQLAKVNEALDAITQNPEVARTLDLVMKAVRF